MKRATGFLFWLLVTGYSFYQLMQAWLSGEIVGHKGKDFNLDSDPILFSITVLLHLLLLAVSLALAVFKIDGKVKQFGGNYNKNTLVAIYKNVLRKSN